MPANQAPYEHMPQEKEKRDTDHLREASLSNQTYQDKEKGKRANPKSFKFTNKNKKQIKPNKKQIKPNKNKPGHWPSGQRWQVKASLPPGRGIRNKLHGCGSKPKVAFWGWEGHLLKGFLGWGYGVLTHSHMFFDAFCFKHFGILLPFGILSNTLRLCLRRNPGLQRTSWPAQVSGAPPEPQREASLKASKPGPTAFVCCSPFDPIY